MKHKLKGIEHIYLILIVFCIVFALVQTALSKTNDSFYDESEYFVSLSSNWHYYTFDSNNKLLSSGVTDTPADIPVSDSVSSVHYVNTIPDNLPTGCYISYVSSFQKIKVYINMKLVDSFTASKGIFSTSVPRGRRFITELPSDCRGKSLTIITSTKAKGWKGALATIYLGSKTSIIFNLLSRNLITLIIGLFLIVGAILLLIYSLFFNLRKSTSRLYPYISTTFLLCGSYLILQTEIIPAIWEDTTAANALEFISVMLLPIPALRLVNGAQQHHFRLLADIISIADIIYVVFSLILIYCFGFDFTDLIYPMIAVISISIAYIPITFIIMFFKYRYLLKKMWTLITGFTIAMAGGVLELITLVISPLSQNGRFLSLGLFGCTLFMIVWVTSVSKEDAESAERNVQQTNVKQAFLANISHEIRTPLNAILAMSTFMTRESSSESVVSSAKDINSAGNKLLLLINNILTISRIDSGKITVKNSEYKTTDFLTDLYNYKNTFFDSGYTFSATVSKSIPNLLTGDLELIRQITSLLLNFILNEKSASGADLAITGVIRSKKRYDIKAILHIQGYHMPQEMYDTLLSEDSLELDTDGNIMSISVAGRLIKLIGGNMNISDTSDGSELTLIIPQQYKEQTNENITD